MKTSKDIQVQRNVGNTEEEVGQTADCHMSHEAGQHDDAPVRHLGRAHQLGVVNCRAGRRDDPQREVLSHSQELVTNQQPQHEAEDEGGEAAVCVGLGEIQNQEELGEQEDVREVTTEDAGKILLVWQRESEITYYSSYTLLYCRASTVEQRQLMTVKTQRALTTSTSPQPGLRSFW